MKEDTMWPEKIAAIYLQFPGLEQAFARNNVDRAYVSRFEESTLDLSTLTEEQPEGEFGTALTFYVSIMFLDPRGQCIVLGQETYLRCFLFWKYEAVRRFDQTVRQAIQKLPAGSTASHVVLVYHNGHSPDDSVEDTHTTRLTVFKPPQRGATLKQWYSEKVIAITHQTTLEVNQE